MSERKRRIGRAWEEYRLKVVPAGASAAQVRETRNAFYAGAGACINSIVADLSPGEEATAEDEDVIREVAEEIEEYLVDLVRPGGQN